MWILTEVLAEGKGVSARGGLKEARAQSCEPTNRNRIEGSVPGRVSTTSRSPSGSGDRVNAAVVQRKFTFLSGEICLASGACAYGSRTEAQSERAGDAIEPDGCCGRQGSRTGGRRESAGIATGPYRDSRSAPGGNARRDGTEVSRGRSSRATVDRARGEGPNMRSQGGAVDRSHLSSSPSGGDASRRDATQPALHDDLMERVLESENRRRAWKRVKANRGAPGIDGMRIEDFPECARSSLPAIHQALCDGTYRPQPVRRVSLPKANGGESKPGTDHGFLLLHCRDAPLHPGISACPDAPASSRPGSRCTPFCAVSTASKPGTDHGFLLLHCRDAPLHPGISACPDAPASSRPGSRCTPFCAVSTGLSYSSTTATIACF